MAVLSSRPEAQQRLLLPRINRRKFIPLAGAAAVAALGTDSVLIEPMRPRLERQEIFLLAGHRAWRVFTPSRCLAISTMTLYFLCIPFEVPSRWSMNSALTWSRLPGIS